MDQGLQCFFRLPGCCEEGVQPVVKASLLQLFGFDLTVNKGLTLLLYVDKTELTHHQLLCVRDRASPSQGDEKRPMAELWREDMTKTRRTGSLRFAKAGGDGEQKSYSPSAVHPFLQRLMAL